VGVRYTPLSLITLLLVISSCGGHDETVTATSLQPNSASESKEASAQSDKRGRPLLAAPLSRTEPTVVHSGKSALDGGWHLVASVGIYGRDGELCVFLESVETGASGGLCGLPHEDMGNLTVAEVEFPPPIGASLSRTRNLIGVVPPAASAVVATAQTSKLESATVAHRKFPGLAFFFLPTPRAALSELKIVQTDGSTIDAVSEEQLGQFDLRQIASDN
jgi:hypothetical protein